MKLPAHIRWPAIIIGALAVHAIAWIAVAWLATSDPSYAVEADYYRKAVEWDDTRRQTAANADLGWRLDSEVAPGTSGGDATVVARLSDRDGEPVDGAILTLEAFHKARSGDVLRAELRPSGDGAYRARLPMRRTGLWELRFTATRADDLFTFRETRHLVLGIRR